ncbi:MAG: ADP-ribosylglycohydrolase family protein [Anaerolineae bacterium]|nr:ADP-ribosylglycohydrolase family protein [Anaerolineae bacterium]
MPEKLTREHLGDRVLGAMMACALGDAMGAATEQWQIDEILAAHGGMLRELIPPPIDTFSYRDKAGYVTDDCSQMFALAEAIIKTSGDLTREAWLERMLDWSVNSPFKYAMGPTTRPIFEALQRGESIERIGAIGQSNRKLTSMGVTNGAGMRVAPAGLINPGDIEGAVRTAWISCYPTHDTQIAASGAAAIAAGVAMALVPGADVFSVVQACLEGAKLGEELGAKEGRRVAGPSIYRRIEIAVEEALRATSFEDALRRIEATVGSSVYLVESGPAAIGIFVAAKGDPVECAVGGTNIGNDTDSTAAMACPLGGALMGIKAIDKKYVKVLSEANTEDIPGMSNALADIAWKRYNA